MKIGDRVKVVEPYNGFPCKVHGTVLAFYELDRVIIETKTGNTWALKKSQVETVRKQ